MEQVRWFKSAEKGVEVGDFSMFQRQESNLASRWVIGVVIDLGSYFNIMDWLRLDHGDMVNWEMYPGLVENRGFNAVISSLMLDFRNEA